MVQRQQTTAMPYPPCCYSMRRLRLEFLDNHEQTAATAKPPSCPPRSPFRMVPSCLVPPPTGSSIRPSFCFLPLTIKASLFPRPSATTAVTKAAYQAWLQQAVTDISQIGLPAGHSRHAPGVHPKSDTVRRCSPAAAQGPGCPERLPDGDLCAVITPASASLGIVAHAPVARLRAREHRP